MYPVIFDIILSPRNATIVMYIAAVAFPGLFAFRAWQDHRASLAEGLGPKDRNFVPKDRVWKVFGQWCAGGVLAVTAFQPWKWTEPLSLPLHTYGLMIAAGFVVGIVIATREATRTGLSADHIMDVSFWVLLSALAGSRILFILVNLDQYFGDNFFADDILLPVVGFRVPTLVVVWRGGMVFYGGLIGAFIASTIYLHKYKLPYWRYVDAMVPSVAAGHFFGRIGCFSAGCCWGKAAPADSIFATYFPEGALAYSQTAIDTHITHLGELTTQAVYPTQLFESLGVLSIFLILLIIRSRKRFHGQVLISYFILYPLFRTLNETFRGDWERGLLFRYPEASPIMLSTSQVISVVVATLGIVFLFQRLRTIRGGSGHSATA